MLKKLSIFNAPPFIQFGDSGYVNNEEGISYCMVKYDKEHYTNELFSIFDIEYPSFLDSSVIKRKSEYLAGRYCGKKLLSMAGSSSYIDVFQGVPVWPENLLGCISHTHNYAIAVLSKKESCSRLGIDIEYRSPKVITQSVNIFSSSKEQSLLNKTRLTYSDSLLILFSAKESLYKALWPDVKHFFDFNAAHIVNINESNNSFTLELCTSLTHTYHEGKKIKGFYSFSNNNVITLIF